MGFNLKSDKLVITEIKKHIFQKKYIHIIFESLLFTDVGWDNLVSRLSVFNFLF